MCEFHLKGQCFHPQKATKGIVATNCSFHDCSDCTSKQWQKTMVDENYAYYQSIIDLTNNQELELNEQTKVKKPLLSKIFSST